MTLKPCAHCGCLPDLLKDWNVDVGGRVAMYDCSDPGCKRKPSTGWYGGHDCVEQAAQAWNSGDWIGQPEIDIDKIRARMKGSEAK